MSESDNISHVFGPVPSRRLGRSLGLDLVPHKVCTLDCLYCQVGRTTLHTIERREYVPAETVVREALARLAAGAEPDYLTVSGSGEPTLNTAFGEVIRRLKAASEVPVALITNGTLFGEPDVRRDAAAADVVLPSLDAGTEEVFRRMNRPHPSLTLAGLVDGLARFREEYGGEIWLEVFLVGDVNTSPGEIEAMRRHVETIDPERIQLNTAVRPTADAGTTRLKAEEMERIARVFGPRAEVVADYSRGAKAQLRAEAPLVLETLRRRPQTLEDLSAGLGVAPQAAVKVLAELEREGRVARETRDGRTFYVAAG